MPPAAANPIGPDLINPVRIRVGRRRPGQRNLPVGAGDAGQVARVAQSSAGLLRRVMGLTARRARLSPGQRARQQEQRANRHQEPGSETSENHNKISLATHLDDN